MPRKELVFISYSRRDVSIVKKMSLVIRAAGANPWRDEDAIDLGDRWQMAISSTIDQCDRIIVFWCRHSRVSEEVKKEYLKAIQANKPLVPVYLDRSELPVQLRAYQSVDVRGLTWWSHEIARWERIPWLAGLLLLIAGGIHAIYSL